MHSGDNRMKYKILVADDSPSYLKVIEEIFKIVGEQFDLVFAENGEVACEKALAIIPDMILMDVIMPQLNGIQALKILKSNPLTEDIPVIVLSATESLKAAFEAGATDFITKPFRHYELVIRVKSALNLVEKLRLVKQQKEILLQQKKDIIADISYSKRIQNAILPSNVNIKKLFPEHFIFNVPKNIVSGDFYWVGEKNGYRIFAVADCTGHGISGAFMTMAGIAFLNEILNKYTFNQASEILSLLRQKVISLLQQKGEEGEAADGMDIALCMFNQDTMELQYAGANNPLYIISDNVLTIIKADRMPIGIHVNYNNPFTNHMVKIKSGDMIYLFSDGYADQFGGTDGKKFRYKNFQELLLRISEMPVEKQEEELNKTFFEWKGSEDQIDDILIAGFRLIMS